MISYLPMLDLMPFTIVKTFNWLEGGYHFRASEENLSLLYDKWLDKDRLCDMVPCINIQDTNLSTDDVFRGKS